MDVPVIFLADQPQIVESYHEAVWSDVQKAVSFASYARAGVGRPLGIYAVAGVDGARRTPVFGGPAEPYSNVYGGPGLSLRIPYASFFLEHRFRSAFLHNSFSGQAKEDTRFTVALGGTIPLITLAPARVLVAETHAETVVSSADHHNAVASITPRLALQGSNMSPVLEPFLKYDSLGHSYNRQMGLRTWLRTSSSFLNGALSAALYVGYEWTRSLPSAEPSPKRVAHGPRLMMVIGTFHEQ